VNPRNELSDPKLAKFSKRQNLPTGLPTGQRQYD
jgi:hypothetical protein